MGASFLVRLKQSFDPLSSPSSSVLFPRRALVQYTYLDRFEARERGAPRPDSPPESEEPQSATCVEERTISGAVRFVFVLVPGTGLLQSFASFGGVPAGHMSGSSFSSSSVVRGGLGGVSRSTSTSTRIVNGRRVTVTEEVTTHPDGQSVLTPPVLETTALVCLVWAQISSKRTIVTQTNRIEAFLTHFGKLAIKAGRFSLFSVEDGPCDRSLDSLLRSVHRRFLLGRRAEPPATSSRECCPK